MNPAPQYEKFTALFDAAHCASCEREVLLFVDVRDERLVHACMHCEQTIDLEQPEARHRRVGDEAARKLGLAFAGDEAVPEFEGCGKPNCNKGKCSKSSSGKHPFA